MLWLFWFVGLLCIGLAIPMLRRRVKPNMFYGLRVRATLADERVWYEANARSARDLVIVGLLVIAGSTALFTWLPEPPGAAPLASSGLLLLGGIVSALRGVSCANELERQYAEVDARAGGAAGAGASAEGGDDARDTDARDHG